ncbi:MAG: hypothetical protein ACOX3U_05770 [Christensenellales bacterium]
MFYRRQAVKKMLDNDIFSVGNSRQIMAAVIINKLFLVNLEFVD